MTNFWLFYLVLCVFYYPTVSITWILPACLVLDSLYQSSFMSDCKITIMSLQKHQLVYSKTVLYLEFTLLNVIINDSFLSFLLIFHCWYIKNVTGFCVLILYPEIFWICILALIVFYAIFKVSYIWDQIIWKER
jgi:hypothetical protein